MNDELPYVNSDLVIKPTSQLCDLRFFNNDNKEVGRFSWDNGIKFEGDAEESAKIFIKWLKLLWGK